MTNKQKQKIIECANNIFQLHSKDSEGKNMVRWYSDKEIDKYIKKLRDSLKPLEREILF